MFVCRHAPGRASVVALAHQEFEEQGDMLNCQVFFLLDKMPADSRRVRAAAEEMLRREALSYEYPGESIMPSTPSFIMSSKKLADAVGSAPSKSVVWW